MFGFDKSKEISQLKGEIEQLKFENSNQKNAIAQLESIQKTIQNEQRNAEFVIDWKKMNAFSIERMMENNIPKTVIGYMLTEPVVTTENGVTYKDVVREWTLYCSDERHSELANEFKKARK